MMYAVLQYLRRKHYKMTILPDSPRILALFVFFCFFLQTIQIVPELPNSGRIWFIRIRIRIKKIIGQLQKILAGACSPGSGVASAHPVCKVPAVYDDFHDFLTSHLIHLPPIVYHIQENKAT